MDASLPRRTVVLLGAGHTNAHILRMWRMEPIPDARLVCVANFPVATYSGMLPGTLAGLYEPAEMEIDLVRLCRSVDVLLIRDPVAGLDVAERRLLFEGRPPLPFDVLSIGIGSVPDVSVVEVGTPSVLAIKPMQTFLTRFGNRLAEIAPQQRSGRLNLTIVGGGVAGLEIAFCLTGRPAEPAHPEEFLVTLVDRRAELGAGLTPAAARAAERELARRDIQLRLGSDVRHIQDGKVTLGDGSSWPADVVLLATSAQPPPLIKECQLPTDARGFLLTDDTLRTTCGAPIFAVGDSGTIDGAELPKAGVYAVRQGPILWANIDRQLRGRPLVKFRPQREFLKLLNTGDGRAIASYRGTGWHAAWCWRWKDFIDRRFMRKYQQYEPANMADNRQVTDAQEESTGMRCLGCGGKVPGAVLSSVLQRLEIPSHESVALGLETPDDAAVLVLPEGRPVVTTVDFFAPPVDDFYLAGRIAALNAASDLFAMGAQPIAALASVVIPHGSEEAQEQLLLELLAGGLQELAAMGATLAGGHSLEGPRVTIGFTMFGDAVGPALRTKGGLQPGDALVLTKPLGSGMLLAAHGQARCRADWYDALVSCMLESNQNAAQLCDELGIVAVTDVTGFGLAGHLLEMLDASRVSAEIELPRLPLLNGCREVFEAGIESTMAPANRRAEKSINAPSGCRDSIAYAALFDPQTSGGLLMGVTPSRTAELLDLLNQRCGTPAAAIGKVTPSQANGRARIEIVE